MTSRSRSVSDSAFLAPRVRIPRPNRTSHPTDKWAHAATPLSRPRGTGWDETARWGRFTSAFIVNRMADLTWIAMAVSTNSQPDTSFVD